MEELMLPCMNKSIFGIECPGCGIQRAMYLLAQFEFAAAFRMFPAIYTTILLFALIALHLVDRARSYQKAIIIVAVANAVTMLVFYFMKMAAIV